MQRSYSTLDMAVFGAVALALLGAVACAIDEAAPVDQHRGGVLQSEAVVGSDADIAAVVSAANTGEIEQSQLALTRAHEPRVLEFAQYMISAHSQAEQHQNALYQRLGIAPQHNPVSTALTAEATSLTASLQNRPSDAFDRAYIEAQIMAHQRVLDLLDTQLVPLAQNPELRAELEEARNVVAQHLAMAQQILPTLPL